jgi:hypothetical protein
MVLVRDVLREWVVDGVRNLRGRIGGGSGKDKKASGIAALEGPESSVRNQLHLKQYIDYMLQVTLFRTPTRIHLLLAIRANFSIRGGYSLHTSSQAGSRDGDDSLSSSPRLPHTVAQKTAPMFAHF